MHGNWVNLNVKINKKKKLRSRFCSNLKSVVHKKQTEIITDDYINPKMERHIFKKAIVHRKKPLSYKMLKNMSTVLK